MADLHAPGWVAASIRAGLSATAALREYRAAGGSIRDTIWRKLYAEQSQAVSEVRNEMTKPLSSTPVASEITVMTTKRREGFLQTLDVFTREVGSNVVTVTPFMFSGSELMSRGDALTKALTLMQTAVDQGRYDQVILGGVYTGTRQMIVGDVS
jgi:hypothetical protein